MLLMSCEWVRPKIMQPMCVSVITPMFNVIDSSIECSQIPCDRGPIVLNYMASGIAWGIMVIYEVHQLLYVMDLVSLRKCACLQLCFCFVFLICLICNLSPWRRSDLKESSLLLQCQTFIQWRNVYFSPRPLVATCLNKSTTNNVIIAIKTINILQ